MYARWPDYLPESIELSAIQLPGHETRISEPPRVDLTQLVRELVEILSSSICRPFALLGHSMGALISYELAHAIRGESGREPCALFLSGLRALHIPNPDTPLHDLAPADFLQRLQSRYGMPTNLLHHAELLELFIPLIRANFQMCESYIYEHKPPLNCPISVFGGLEDLRISRTDLAGWTTETRNEVRLRMIPGDHYFFEHDWLQILNDVVSDLSDYLAAR